MFAVMSHFNWVFVGLLWKVFSVCIIMRVDMDPGLSGTLSFNWVTRKINPAAE